jgi:hypothetical protein
MGCVYPDNMEFDLETEENYEKPQSGNLATYVIFEPGNSRIRFISVTAALTSNANLVLMFNYIRVSRTYKHKQT